MSAVAVKGWCPGALRPMQSGDGLLVRIRPHAGRVDARQAKRMAELAERYGNGLVDVTNRANLQIRGVSETSCPPLIDGLAELGLLDPDPDTEARRNILITPFWNAADETISIAAELEHALVSGPHGLPTKFGFALDCGSVRVLAQASADVRIERDSDGRLVVRADGAKLGRIVTRKEVVPTALALAEWFVNSGGAPGGRGRMAAHLGDGATLPKNLCGDAPPGRNAALPLPGPYPQGVMIGVAFGQLTPPALRLLGARANGLRLTPWRMILAEGTREMPACDGLIAQAEHPILRVIACSGAPRCREAHADTRALAIALAPSLPADANLHISGCAKACARSGPASVTLLATREGFDLVRGGSTHDEPVLRGLSYDTILSNPSLLSGAG
jgi:precorrin-3B synthase